MAKVWIVYSFAEDRFSDSDDKVDSVWSTEELARARVKETNLLPGRQPYFDYEGYEVDYV